MADVKITENSLRVWKALPKTVKNDPCLDRFRVEFERIYGFSGALEPHENYQLLRSSASVTQTEQLERGDVVKNIKTNRNWTTITKIMVLLAAWIISAVFLLSVKEKQIHHHLIAVENNKTSDVVVSEMPDGKQIAVTLEGPFTPSISNTENIEFMSVSVSNSDGENVWKLPLQVNSENESKLATMRARHIFLVDKKSLNNSGKCIQIKLKTNSSRTMAVKLEYDPQPVNMEVGTIYAGIILVFLNVLIISEVIHRTFAAILAAFLSVGTLAALDDRPSMSEIVNWVDSETLLLIFSMMILVAVLTDTGIFDYIAVDTFKMSNGRIWPLISTLCIVTVTISAFLDNVTTILLMTPIVVRLCECLHLNPVPIFPIIILHANIAGLSTLIGHPPNLMITANPYVAKYGVSFLTYSSHMIFGVVLALVQTNIQIQWQYRNINDKLAIRKVPSKTNDGLSAEEQLALWEEYENISSLVSPVDVQLLQKLITNNIDILRRELEKNSQLQIGTCIAPALFKQTLARLKAQYPIKDRQLLAKSGFVLIFVLFLFVIESIPQLQRLSLGWCALVGVLLLLIVSDHNLDSLMQRVEWTTLLFFGSMFITMECLARLGLINWIGNQTESLILFVDKDYRLAVAIIIVLWVSALTSSVVDSVPVTAMMIKVVATLAQNVSLALPVQPLVWALAFGPTMGGNGTLYGASANIVCAGVAEKLGHKISFFQYFKVGFPVMLGNVVLTTAYLMVAHVIFEWH